MGLFSINFRTCFAGLMALSVAGCNTSFVSKGAVEYNLALSDAGEKMTFINILRASQRRSLAFAGVGNVSNGYQVTGSLGFSLPFGGDANNAFSATPNLSGRAGPLTANYSNLNNSDATVGLNKPISAEVYQHFFDYGWARDVLFNMFVGRIIVSPKVNTAIFREAERKCAAKQRDIRTKSMCNNRENGIPQRWIERVKKSIHKPFDETKVAYFNSARNPAAYWSFQYFSRTLRILQIELQDVEADKPPVLKIPNSVRGLGGMEISADGEKNRVFIRSPIAMLQYLGGHAAAQLFADGDAKFTPTIGIGSSFRQVALFRVKRGTKPLRNALSVKFEGAQYHVPNPNFGSKNEDRSFQVLSLLDQAIALNTNPENLAGTEQILLVGG